MFRPLETSYRVFMNRYLLEMQMEASSIMDETLHSIDDIYDSIEKRKNNESRAKQFGELFLIVVILTGLVVGGYQFYSKGVAFEHYVWKNIGVIGISSIISVSLFGIVMCCRYINKMTHYSSIFKASDEIDEIKKYVQSKRRSLETFFLELKNIDDHFRRGISVNRNIERQMHSVEEKVISKSDLQEKRMNRLSVFLLYLCVTIWGLLATTLLYQPLQEILKNVSSEVSDDTYSAILIVGICVGLVVQYWLTWIYVKSRSGNLDWISSLLPLSGVAGILIGVIAVGLIVVVSYLIYALVRIAIYLLIFALVIGLICVFFSGG